jgi:hypothetical protein
MLQRIAAQVGDSQMIEIKDINIFKPSRSWSLEYRLAKPPGDIFWVTPSGNPTAVRSSS